MGIFSSISNAIFGSDEKEKAAPAPAPKPAAAPPAAPAKPERAAISQVDVAKRLDAIPGSDKLNWRTSIVDLMKLVRIDPGFENRKELAEELGMVDYKGTAEQNIALHRAVMNKIALAGGIVPDDLKD
jgi:hypothetical protein